MADDIPFDVDPFDSDLPFDIDHPQPAEPLDGEDVARFLKGDRWASFVNKFRVTDYELGILAQHFLNVACEVTMFEREFDDRSRRNDETRYAARCRLDAIEQALGAWQFEAAIAKPKAKWKQAFAEVDKKENAMTCVKCGAKRRVSELLDGGRKDLCWKCLAETTAALGPCAKCGSERQGQRGEDTGDLCHQCYFERCAEILDPCPNCGGKRDIRRLYGALCYECHTAPIAPCKDCGEKRSRGEIGDFDHGYCNWCAL
jgi:hypothetical protein